MPIPMPYYLEKGPFFAVLEDYLNSGPRTRLTTALQKLRAGDTWDTFEMLRSPSLQDPSQAKATDWVAHLNRHWFGKHRNRKGEWVQPKFDAQHHSQTGYWLGYYGDVDAITRATLIRTLEVALGVDHTDDPAEPIRPTRRWYVDFLWKCSQSWFEGWVTWRRTGTATREGHVTVIFATPPVEGSVVLDSPLLGRPQPEFRVGPTGTHTGRPWAQRAIDGARGMWVVTASHNDGYVGVGNVGAGITTSSGTPSGQWPSPLPGRVHASGDVVTVAPSMADGGVLAGGLTYSPPP